MAMNAPFRGGMQVHAVPDDERALDSSGRALPWGYAYADANLNRKQPVERGPFGKTTSRRTLSRSKTATPATREDLARLENQRYQDEIFSKFMAEHTEKQGALVPAPSRNGPPPRALSVQDLSTSTAGPGPSAKADPLPDHQQAAFSEPTEVMINGYLPSHLPSALTFYESASLGTIYEDYERAPAPNQNPRYASGLLNPATARARTPRNLTSEAMAKINTYSGGRHWIKVTFDSPLSAQRAISASPHVLGGCEVHASLFTGAGPAQDSALPAGRGGGVAGSVAPRRGPARREQHGERGFASFPARMHSAPNMGLGDSTSSTETAGGASSSTANGTASTATGGSDDADSTATLRRRDPFASPSTTSAAETRDAQQPPPPPRREPRIRGARLVTLQPAEAALMPVVPWSVRAFGGIPLLGALVVALSGAGASHAQAQQAQQAQRDASGGGGGGLIGSTVPRNDKGEFDWARASLWWVICWYLDWWLGTDLCGLRSED